jgi:hypothetical protein
MEPVLIGYFPRHPVPGPQGLSPGGVERVCSLGHYVSDGPANWIDQWRHNEMWFYDSEELVRKVIAEAIQIHLEPDPERDPPWQVRLTRERGAEFEYFAYKLFPVSFTEGKPETFPVPVLKVAPLAEDYQRLGYDAVNKTGCAHFECSPLCCNGMSEEIPVNRWCLIDEQERAFAVANYFSVRKPEPGPYFVVEVWRKTGGQSQPEARKA